MSDTAYVANGAARASNRAVTFAVPREGSLARDLFLVIPATSRDPRPAEALFAFLLQPDVAARLTQMTGLITAVPRGLAALPREGRSDAAIGLARAGFNRETDPGRQIAGLRERFWQLIDAPGSRLPAAGPSAP
jgi:spermidine/putrescine-binding protein